MYKYALLQYRDTNNIGDEIQSVAARQFLPRVDYYLDRDTLGSWKNAEQNETIKLIANGWYMHEPYAWPITEKSIAPLLISMHINDTDRLVTERFSSPQSRKYLTEYGPVGARDSTTKKFFLNNKVDAYFSGCLTLTLRRDKNIKQQDYILAVSLSDESYEYLKKKTKKRIIRFGPNVDKGLDNIEKTKIAEYILYLYQSSSCVVTTRLHAMLPSLALETPVLYVDENEGYDPSRYDGLVGLVRSVGRQNFLSGDYEYDFDNPPKNPEEYKKYREALIKKCEDYTENKSSNTFAREVDFSKMNQDTILKNLPVSKSEQTASQIARIIKPPAFSIIMPAYNVGDCIIDAVKSIKDQEFTDFECIIIDDGSTDGSVKKAIDLAKDDGRFIFRRQKNGGLSNARNNGYALARGDYILFLDSDDIFDTSLLKKVYEKIIASNAEVIIYNYSVLDSLTGHVTKKVNDLSAINTYKTIRAEALHEKVFNTFGNQVWTKVFSRKLIDRLGLKFDEKLKRAEDIPFTYTAILKANNLGIIDEPLVAYRINRGNSNSDLLSSYYKDIFISLDKVYALIKSLDNPEKYANSFNNLFIENIYYNLESLLGSPKFSLEFSLAKKYSNKLEISTDKEDYLNQHFFEVSEIIQYKNHIDMVVYIALNNKRTLAEKQTIIFYLEDDLENRKRLLVQRQETIDNLLKQYEIIKEKYDRLIKIPRQIKHKIRVFKRKTTRE